MTTYAQHLRNGSRMAYVYHVAGLDWAACSDADMAAYLNGSTGATLRRYLYGAMTAQTAESYSSSLVQNVVALSPDLGTQTVSSSREGGIDVGSWTVSIQGEAGAYKFGKDFPYVAYAGNHQGLTGLNWAPDPTDPNIHCAVMSADLRLNRNTTSGVLGAGTLHWDVSHDYTGLYGFVAAKETEDGGVYLWVGSSCLVTTAPVSLSGRGISVAVKGGQFNTPLEDLFYSPSYRYQISSVPLEMAGSVARLFAIPFDVTESIDQTAGYDISYGVGYI